MTKNQAKQLRLQMFSALEQAFDCDTVAPARCCLESALAYCEALADGGQLKQDDRHTVNETFAALAARGWM